MTTVETRSIATPMGRVSYSETGEGRSLVLLHSLLTDRQAFDPVIPDLPGRVISVDLPGFGETDLVAPSIEDFAALIAGAVAEICPGEAPTVMGNGLGSFVALGMAIGHPDLVGALVLVGCGATFPEPARPAFANMIQLVETGGIAAVTPVALRRIYTDEYLDDHPEEAEERSRVMAHTDPTAFVEACRALLVVDFTETAAAVQARTLIVVGDQDQATPPDMARALDALLPHSVVVVLPELAHAPQLQDPRGFVNAIEKFLEGE